MCRIVTCISSNMRKPYIVEDFTVTAERPENGVCFVVIETVQYGNTLLLFCNTIAFLLCWM